MAEIISSQNLADACKPFEFGVTGQHFLSIRQLGQSGLMHLMSETRAAQTAVNQVGGLNLLPWHEVRAVMRQPSTRTGGSFVTAAHKLGAKGFVVSGMQGSSEAKGETVEDSWLAFAAQSDILGIRTAENYGPHHAAQIIDEAARHGRLRTGKSVINLGDGTNEHPTQAVGDLFTIHEAFGYNFTGLQLGVVGDLERYRAFGSLIKGAVTLGVKVYAVTDPCVEVPLWMDRPIADGAVTVTDDLDAVMKTVHVLYVGRNPNEYTGDNRLEQARSRQLAKRYESWQITNARLEQMDPEAIVMHPRPRLNELPPEVDGNTRMRDVLQMQNMVYARMAILAACTGKSIAESLSSMNEWTA